MGKKWVYIASAYTKGDVGANVLFQMGVWNTLFELGVVPIAPLWSHFQHIHRPRQYQDWVEYDNELIKRCDIVLRMDSVADISGQLYVQHESPGADAEVELALRLGKPVCYGLYELRHVLGLDGEAGGLDEGSH